MKNTSTIFVAATLGLGLALGGCHKDEQNAADTATATPTASTAMAQQAPTPAPVAPAPAPARTAAAERPHHTTRHQDVASFEAPSCTDCGTITNIEALTQSGTGNTMGTIAGAVIGGVIGHQFGSGRGNTVATAAGAAGGAYAGNRAQAYYNRSTSYKVTVAMQNGGTRTVTVTTLNGMAVGNKVKVVGDTLQPS
ncbi:MAG TPA: glycine zipper 2TM domain-containing protein [Nevskiaceae bacterium]|nr:glycine zipper 2TM domain-containing protein [Nevskiaceae bacterium]